MSRIDPDKERAALEIQRRNGLISEYRYQLSILRLKYPDLESAELIVKYDKENGRHTAYASCYRCRRFRSDTLCYGCPKAGLRNVWIGIEWSVIVTAVSATVSVTVVMLIMYIKGVIG